ncbi:hypothetical protein RB195_004030 [Necator americanus]|uniref:Serine carboxypeptidase S28 n=1 Tax=Necator americanus TaxID=51031 RepID=A0ABR1BJJ0_NECAM
MTRIRLLGLHLIQIWTVIAWQPQFFLGRPMFGMRNGHEHLQRLLLQRQNGKAKAKEEFSSVRGIGPSQAYFNQKLDHFNNNSDVTWSQRYFYNFQFQASGSNVAFLMIGGEGPESIGWVSNENYPFVKWSKQFGAAVFLLEHRFYGESHPTPNQSVENLVYLSSRQAIEDVANFIRSMNVKYEFKNPLWITFGGSYSGALSLWARQAHPELIVGAVGSSAPLNVELDFWGYLQVVEDALRSYSCSCAENIRQGFETMENLMQTQYGRQKLSDVFVLDPPFSDLPLTYNDKQNFFLTIFDSFQGAVQYSGDNMGPYAQGYGIPDVCKIMDNKNNDPLKNIQLVNEYMTGMYEPFQRTPNSYNDMIEYLRREEFGDSLDFDSSARSWAWQTCTEFGYFQTTDGGPKGIFGSSTPLTLYLNMCSDVFGTPFSSDSISSAVHSTQLHYGGSSRYKGTNVVIPNGSIDPWHALGKYTSTDGSVVWYLINGTAHCADMYPASVSDKPGLTKMRSIIERNLGLWLSKSPNPYKNVVTAEAWTKPQEQTPLKGIEREVAPKHPIELSKMKFPKWIRNKKMHLGRPPHGFLPPPEKVVADPPLGYETGYFLQTVDHFDNQNPNTFLQRYYKNTQWARPDGPNFLMIGGEGPLTSRWVLNGNITYLSWAQKFGATVYALEHRYYGNSIVGGTAQNPNPDLTYLSSVQMLHDVANFIRTINYNTNNTAPWITFGGSYAGCLSLWMRELFPNLILGAVGSSAPLQAKLDFYEYLEVVETAIKSYSPSCAANIAEGFAEMHNLSLHRAGREQLSDLFTLTPAWTNATNITELDLQFFFSNVYSQFQGAVQYSGDNTGGYASGHGIPDMCRYMNNNGNSAIQNIAEFNEYMTIFYSGENVFEGTENSYSDYITELKDAQRYGPFSGAALLWTWQTCTEFGYFQSSDSGYGIFGSPTPVNLFTRVCADTFGEQYTAVMVQKNIDRINELYGGKDYYKGTNVVIPNGSIDPWHALGKYSSDDPSVIWYLINGTAHCADMYPSRPQDLPDLIEARKITEDNIANWLKQASTRTWTISTSTVVTASSTLTSFAESTTLPMTPADSTSPTTISKHSPTLIGLTFAAQFSTIFYGNPLENALAARSKINSRKNKE